MPYLHVTSCQTCGNSMRAFILLGVHLFMVTFEPAIPDLPHLQKWIIDTNAPAYILP